MATMTEGHVNVLIAAAIAVEHQTLVEQLRQEFAATQETAETRLTEVQSSMSKELREEFAATKKYVEDEVYKAKEIAERGILELRGLVDDTVTMRFKDADEKFEERITAEKAHLIYTTQELHTQIQELQSSWELVKDGELKITKQILLANFLLFRFLEGRNVEKVINFFYVVFVHDLN